MSGMHLEVKITGDAGSQRVILSLGERAADLNPVFRAWAKDFNRYELEQFASFGGYGGTPWAPLSASTVVLKARKGQNPAILRVTDQLLNSLTRWPAKRAIRRVGKDIFEIGSLDEKIEYHQQGTKNMPARPVVVFNEVDKIRWMDMLERYVSTGKM